MIRSVLLILLLSLFVSPLTAEDNTMPRAAELNLRNVRLTERGEFIGQVVTHTGQPVINLPVTISCTKQSVTVYPDQTGKFRISGLPEGLCMLQVDGDTYACRLWNHQTAPPKSLSSVAIVTGTESKVRGNRFSNNRLSKLDKKGALFLASLGGVAVYFAGYRQDAS